MSSAQELQCLFCKEVFDNKDELQIHFRKHGDPKFNQSLKVEAQSTMDENTEEKELVSCDVCPEVFPTISKAITHKHKVHPDHDAKYFCPWCGKLFTMKHLYNKHIQSTHDKEESKVSGFHCDYCDVDFFLPSAMLNHNKFFHRQDTELAAIGHSKKLKMFNQEPLPIYYCPFCGEEYCNKVNLHKHMGDDHIDENQSPEDVLRCPLCEAVFYHLDAYELHLTFHSIEDLYGDENPLANQITEFSLETAPPVMEKVENESQEDECGGTIGIEELLQQAMNENEDGRREKKKKHKKHKKSKKSVITLDEFLNMNSDVFGEGIDVEGIEEVPTQVVAKQLRKVPQKIRARKAVPTSEIERLKKLGIAVKKKPTPNINRLQGVKVVNKRTPINTINYVKTVNKIPIQQTNPNVQNQPASDDILSKLCSSQIKVVKKSVQDKEISPTDKAPPETASLEPCKHNSTVADKVDKTNEDTEEKSLENLSKHEEKDQTTSQKQETDENISETRNNTHNKRENNADNQLALSIDNNLMVNKKDKTDNLRNINPHVTVKPASTNKNLIDDLKSKLVDEENNGKSMTQTQIGKEPIPLPFPSNSKNIENFGNKNVKNSFNALKHLSHLITVKSVSQPKDISLKLLSEEHFDGTKLDSEADIQNNTTNHDLGNTDEPDEEKIYATRSTTNVESASPTHDALKNLSKHITIKSLSPKTATPIGEKTVLNPSKEKHDHDENTEHIQTKILSKNQNATNKTLDQKVPSPKTVNRIQISNGAQNQTKMNDDITKKCASIFQKLSNVTARPINTDKSVTGSATFQSQSGTVQKSNTIQSTVQREETKQQEIEIFNIDDSDDEDVASRSDLKTQISSTPVMPKRTLESNKSSAYTAVPPKQTYSKNKSADVLKNLSTHITIKQTNVSKPSQSVQEEEDNEDEETDIDVSDAKRESVKNLEKQIDQKNLMLQNKLKSLGNITVKSRNSSPKSNIAMKPRNSPKSTISHDIQSNNDAQMYDDDSDSNTSGKVKITELPDDFCSDDDLPLAKNTKSNKNVTVQEPTDSDNDHHDLEEVLDFESQIKPNTLKRPKQEPVKAPAFLNNLKNVTIKSLRDTNTSEDEDVPEPAAEDDSNITHKSNSNITQKDSRTVPSNINKNLSVKPFRESQQGTRGPTAVKNNTQNIATSDQVNTQKQVTVKTFQTKTVIEEITTTVTKTIRTVNQTVNQELRNVSQSTSTSIRPQRVQGIRPQVKKNQGVPIRPAAPIMGPRFRNAVNVRPQTVRPCNQIVPARMNVARMSQPRMPKNPAPVTNVSHTAFMGKPLKISPHAMVTTSKRSTSAESNGPFSCFKKAKESLVPDDPAFNNNLNNAGTHLASSSHFSRSDFASTTTSVKGNTVVKSTQIKSEVNASREQLTKLNSMSGLKVVKTSQMQQASKVEEHIEVNPAKRTALEAIEKLQRQGLLVKKPRIEEPNDSEHSDAGDDYDNDGECCD